MVKQGDERLCTLYISPDERRLLARIAGLRGVGRDYLALEPPAEREHSVRPIPHWLGREQEPAAAPRARPSPHERHCHSCAHVANVPAAAGARRVMCAAGMWGQTMQARSLHTSMRLRLLSLTCPAYQRSAQPAAAPPRHCRACRELAEAQTPDERYVCGREVWTNPMKPQSVANAQRLARLSAACPFYAPRAGRWLARSGARRPAGED